VTSASAAVPAATIARLPLYLRALLEARSLHMPVISSEGIAGMAGTNAAQVRKDLSHLGELGTRGIGYDVDTLAAHIAGRLGLDQRRRVAIVGVGRLGGALLGYGGFAERGFDLVAAFDTDPALVGKRVGEVTVAIATPSASAQAVASRAVAVGVRAILLFAPVSIELPDDVAVRQVDLSVEMQVLSFHLAQK
jgi:redox-sensing transcriptional repressor